MVDLQLSNPMDTLEIDVKYHYDGVFCQTF